MTVSKLFELFMLRKITIFILLILFNIAAFFTYDLVSMNHQIRLKMEFPISIGPATIADEEGIRIDIDHESLNIVDSTYIFNKYSTGSVMGNILQGANKTNYKIYENKEGKYEYLDVLFTCEIKENCITASKLLLVALDNEAKVFIEGNKTINEIQVSKIKDKIKNLNNKRKNYINKRDVLVSTEEDYIQISKENIDEANNLDNLSTMVLLQDINNERLKASITLADVSINLAKINNDIYTEEMKIKYYSALTEVKHLFKWIVEPSISNVGTKVSFSLWLTLSFLMSIALYFLAAVVINIKQTKL